ncbi:hypothetical protein [Paenibacillus elgii]|uniref:hypothetical protein n=1 Tax=Paenibacillus elgii TaxID=189691 RepID=UPI0013D2FCDA|nr:hypothetical protein [Paenibacillus elgii]
MRIIKATLKKTISAAETTKVKSPRQEIAEKLEGCNVVTIEGPKERDTYRRNDRGDWVRQSVALPGIIGKHDMVDFLASCVGMLMVVTFYPQTLKTCPECGGTSADPLHTDVVECRACGFQFLSVKGLPKEVFRLTGQRLTPELWEVHRQAEAEVTAEIKAAEDAVDAPALNASSSDYNNKTDPWNPHRRLIDHRFRQTLARCRVEKAAGRQSDHSLFVAMFDILCDALAESEGIKSPLLRVAACEAFSKRLEELEELERSLRKRGML